MPTKEWLLTVGELKRVGLVCRRCSTETVIDLLSDAIMPTKCGACSEDVPEYLLKPLGSLRDALRGLKDQSVRVHVQIEPSVPPTAPPADK